MGAAPVKKEFSAPPSASSEGGKVSHGEIFELGVEKVDFGRTDSLRFKVLTTVLQENYDRAIQDLKEFQQSESEFPNFKEKIVRYISHAIDLVYAIKAKRSFPGINSLTRAKQQELREKFKEHFRELRYTLTRIEKVEADLRIEDARSTIYVIRALCFSALALILVWFMLEIVRGLAMTSTVVIEDITTKAVNWLFDSIGW